jgi:ribosomal protein L11 methyltransferase
MTEAPAGQTRFYVRTGHATALALYAAVEQAFEDDGLPLGIYEVDEQRAIDEVSVYVTQNAATIGRRLRRIVEEISPSLSIGEEIVPDVDWVSRSLEGLTPVRAGRFLVHGAHDRGKRRAGDLAIEIEAALAFGTGHHGTTAGCLELITELVRRERPRTALDLGTGSGVLAIALARLAHAPVLASDIDPVATAIAAHNARLNHVQAYVTTVTATGFRNPLIAGSAPFDLIVANILARPLIRLAPAMAAHLSPGGSVILSGLLARQRLPVLSAYVGQRFRHLRTLTRGGWASLHLKR